MSLGLCALAAMPAGAQESGGLAQLGLREGTSDLPGVGRVLVVLAAAITLAVVVVYALRRFLPGPILRRPTSPVRLGGQVAVSGSLKLHLVELDHTTLVVAEGRSGVAIVELAKADVGRERIASVG